MVETKFHVGMTWYERLTSILTCCSGGSSWSLDWRSLLLSLSWDEGTSTGGTDRMVHSLSLLLLLFVVVVGSHLFLLHSSLFSCDWIVKDVHRRLNAF